MSSRRVLVGAVLVLAAVAVVGGGLLVGGVGNGGAGTPSPTATVSAPATTLPSASPRPTESTTPPPTPSPTASPTPVATPTPSPSPSPIASPSNLAARLPVPPGTLRDARWSPDSRHFVLVGDDDVELLDASGLPVRSTPGQAATWVDATHFAVMEPLSAGVKSGRVWLESVDGERSVLTGTYAPWPLLGDGHGHLALAPAASPGRYVVWTAGHFGRSVAGVPLAWSPRGDTLFALDRLPVGRGVGDPRTAPARFISYPNGTLVRSFAGIEVYDGDEPAFSPDGTMVAVSCARRTREAGCHAVLFGTTGSVRDLTSEDVTGAPLSWVAARRLLVPPASYPAPGALREWRGAALVRSSLPPASYAVATSSGTVALENLNAQPALAVTRVYDRRGARISELPGAARLVWSPDGSALILLQTAGGGAGLFRMP